MLTCGKTIEFAIDVGFSELVIEGINVNVIHAISSSLACQPVFVRKCGGRYSSINTWSALSEHYVHCTRRGRNKVAHTLAQQTRNISHDLY